MCTNQLELCLKFILLASCLCSCRNDHVSVLTLVTRSHCFQKSRQQADKETDSNQTTSFMKTAVNEQKLPSSFVVQDAVRNVTIKPETTRRQDDVTGRLPRYTRYTSPRMMKARARTQELTLNSHRDVPQKVCRITRLL